MPPVNLSKGTNGCNKNFGVNDNFEIEKILSPEKIGKEYVVKLSISLGIRGGFFPSNRAKGN